MATYRIRITIEKNIKRCQWYFRVTFRLPRSKGIIEELSERLVIPYT
jgi:hypothetical protein